MPDKTRRLLERVATRHRVAVLGLWTYRFVLIFSAVYIVGLLCARVFVWLSNDMFNWMTVGVVPCAAVVAALFAHRGLKMADAARLVDLRMDAKDLYLTTATMHGGDGAGEAPGQYKPLVSAAAEQRAGDIRPQTVVPFDWSPNTTRALGALLLAVGLTFIPVFDVFGSEEERLQEERQIAELNKDKQIAVKKAAELKRQAVEAKHSQDVERVLDDLRKTFNQMKPQERELNQRKLAEQRKVVNDKWKDVQKERQERDKEANGGTLPRGFDTFVNKALTKKFKDELDQGSTDSLEQQFKQMRDTLDKIANAKTKEEEQQAKQELRQQMQQMKDFAQGQPGGQQMAQALDKALQQLQAGNEEGAKQAAMDALQQQMNLSEQQMKQMAQQARNLQSLKQAMEAIQNAQQANKGQQDGQGLDGKECANCKTMADYAKLYNELMQGQGQQGQGGSEQAQNDGQGSGGRGQGKGEVSEDDSAQSNFVTRKSKSHVQAGKILLKWKSDELASGGQSELDFQEAARKLQDGVPEALVQEQVPPGYHEVIKKYFDSLERNAKPAGGEKKSGDD